MGYFDKLSLDPTLFRPLEPEPVESRGLLRGAADTALSFGQGAVQGVRMFTDLAGADNAASAGLRSVEDAIDQLKSAQAKQDQQEVARILSEAEGAGILDQVVAGAKAFAVAPGQMLAQAAGTTIPTLAAALVPGAGPAALAGRLALPAAVGAAQGVGTVKGSIYDAVLRGYKEDGATDEEAKAAAVRAQEYSGENAGQLALGGAFGALAGSSGLESAAQGLKFGARSGSGMLSRVAKGAAFEAIPEGLQGGQEKYAANTALINEGADIDPMSGVFAAGTMEAAAGAPLGGAFGIPKPKAQPIADIAPILGAESIDEAINAASDAVSEPTSKRTPEAALDLLDSQRMTDESLLRKFGPEDTPLVDVAPATIRTAQDFALPAAPAAAEPAVVEPTDLTTQDGVPYGSKTAANVRAVKEGLTAANVVEIPGAGWVIRPQLDAQPTTLGTTIEGRPNNTRGTTAADVLRTPDVAVADVDRTAPLAAGAGDVVGADAGRGGRDIRPDADANGRVPVAAPAPVPSGRAAAAVGDGDVGSPNTLTVGATVTLDNKPWQVVESTPAAVKLADGEGSSKFVGVGSRTWAKIAPVDAVPDAPAVVPGTGSAEAQAGRVAPAEPERVKVMTRFGQNVYVNKADFDSDKPRMRHFTSTGKSLGLIVRENLDPTGELRATDAKEQAGNAIFDVIGTRNGAAFASEAAAARERSMRGLGESHDIVPAAGGFILKRKAAPVATTRAGSEPQTAAADQFIRTATKEERLGGRPKQRAMQQLQEASPKPGFAVVFKPYGANGAGFYYAPTNEETAPAATPKSPVDTKAAPAEPWQMTREEAAKDFPGDEYDKMLNRASDLGDISYDDASKRSRIKSTGGRQFWAQTRKQVEQGIKDAVRAARGERADANKMKASEGYAAWRIRATNLKNKAAVNAAIEYGDGLLAVHKERVQEALAEGKDVPAEVLADYPDLKPKALTETAARVRDTLKGAEPAAPVVKDSLTPASATHKDPGEPAEVVTPTVVKEAIKTALRTVDRKPSEMKAELLAKVDAAITNAKADKAEQIERSEAARNDGTSYVTFDVPGDGVFKVMNARDKLTEFRKQVDASPGFSGRATTPPRSARTSAVPSAKKYAPPDVVSFGVQNGSSSDKAAINNMIDDGDPQAAVDYAAAKGVNVSEVLAGDKVRLPKVAGLTATETPAPETSTSEPTTAASESAAPLKYSEANKEAKRLTAETGTPHQAVNRERVDEEGFTVSEWFVEPTKAAPAGKPAPGRYAQPVKERGASRDGQMEMAQRGSRIASLAALNDMVRQREPDAAYTDDEIQNAANIDAMQDWLSARGRAAQSAAEPVKTKPARDETTTQTIALRKRMSVLRSLLDCMG